jgi:hypothetical protein
MQHGLFLGFLARRRIRYSCADSKRPRPIRRLISVATVGIVWALMPAGGGEAHAAADLYMKDTPADTGLEPNPDAGPL